jgi:yeast amino acid transporter
MDFEKQHSSYKEGVSRRIFSNGSSPDEELFRHGGAGEFGETHRGLKSRHIQFLALGMYLSPSSVRLGLMSIDRWMYWHWTVRGSGQVLSLVGPAPLLMSYIVMSSIIWVVMNNLGEMTAYMPISGVSVPYFVKRYCEPSLAFAAG